MAAYYNEIEPYAAEWLRNLIKQGLIADGEVDERSIVDIRPADLRGFAQCHFFAGIGVWSYALRLAGWGDDRAVWTGSCPCQPFSAAGKGKGFDDERHLWPVFYRLIAECRPAVVFGEQVASKDGLQWLDAVCSDMEASGYAIGAADMCAAGVGAPHIRQRLWFVGERLEHAARNGRQEWRPEPSGRGAASGCGDERLADAQGQRYIQREVGDEDGTQRASGGGGQDERLRQSSSSGASRDERLANAEGTGSSHRGVGAIQPVPAVSGGADGRLGHHHHQGLEGQRSGHQAEGGWIGAAGSVAEAGELVGLADANGAGAQRWARDDAEAPRLQEGQRQPEDRAHVFERGGADHGGRGAFQGDGLSADTARPRPTNGHWRDADWLHCRDGRWRPVEPGTFPLAHGAPARVGRLRAYGNAIVPQVAAEVIGAYMEARP